MKKYFSIAIVIIFIGISSVFSQVPQKISYQGVLTDIDGVALNGNYNIQFSLYNTESGGTPIWQEIQDVLVTNSIFDVYLGSVNPIILSFNSQYWLEIQVGSSLPLPRVMLASSPYSFISKNVVNNAITSEKIANGTIQGEDLNQMGAVAGNVLSWDGFSWQPVEPSEIVEIDPIFTNSVAFEIDYEYIDNWNTAYFQGTEAYSWGNHADYGYLTSLDESDPIFADSWASSITDDDISNWNDAFVQGTEAYGWGNHADYGYLSSFEETDPIFADSWASSITGYDISNWNNAFAQGTEAYGWGNHADYGYLSSFEETDPIFADSWASSITDDDILNWNDAFAQGTEAYGWGNHADYGYLTSLDESDPIFADSWASSITDDDISNWNSAYGWGNHASAGYLSVSELTNNYIPKWSGSTLVNGTLFDNGSIGIGTTSPSAKFQVNNGSVLYEGTTGETPTSGAGTRFMWIPAKKALRAGYVSTTQWNDANIGDYSVAFGYGTTASGYSSTAFGCGTTASGYSSTAFGYGTTASGYYATAIGYGTTASGSNSVAIGYGTTASESRSVAIGYGTTASGNCSVAMGNTTTASGNCSVAMGNTTTASGNNSVAMGYNTTAQAYSSLVLGRYNLISGTTDTWINTEPVFVIGNGTSSTATSNAFTVNKNGNTGISRLPATNKLEVEGNASKTTAGDWLANSDRRIKTDILDIDNSIDLLMKLRPVKFRYTPEYIKLHPFIENKYYYNFIAQEFQQVFPESVKGSGELLNGTNEEILQIDTYNSQIITIKAVQELVKENEKLNKKIDELQNELVKIKQLLQNIDSKK